MLGVYLQQLVLSCEGYHLYHRKKMSGHDLSANTAHNAFAISCDQMLILLETAAHLALMNSTREDD